METWMQILGAIVFGAMAIFLIPVAKNMLQNSPKAGAGDWQAFLLPIAGVILFVVILIMIVRA